MQCTLLVEALIELECSSTRLGDAHGVHKLHCSLWGSLWGREGTMLTKTRAPGAPGHGMELGAVRSATCQAQ
jgi:hypothetical protein